MKMVASRRALVLYFAGMPRGGARPGAGRPPVADVDRRVYELRLRVSLRELAEVRELAEREGESVSQWVRDRILLGGGRLDRG